ncbi:MAG TPA: hypothetical protein VG710_01700 [Opitutus sp.]|nr:hypothetical protein [Opitutus sp.]
MTLPTVADAPDATSMADGPASSPPERVTLPSSKVRPAVESVPVAVTVNVPVALAPAEKTAVAPPDQACVAAVPSLAVDQLAAEPSHVPGAVVSALELAALPLVSQ